MDRLSAAPAAGLAPAFRALPEAAPLEMPVQSLPQAPRRGRPATSPRGMGLRRGVVIGGAVALTVEGAHEMYLVLSVGGMTTLEILVLVLFVALFAWIALSFTSALAGFFSLLAGGGRRLLDPPGSPLPPLSTRTALLMPTYNESPARVMAAVQAIDEALRTAGVGAHFDSFILSDTTDPDVWIAEEAGFLAVRARTGGDGRIFYRRRAKNTERKAGNIADWVRRFGAAYPQMLVLDADSVMTADAIIRLAAAMERNPGVGVIQTLPIIVNGTSLFARMQQFAGRVYGPLIAYGIAWWHGSEGNYWGHNAIIRTRAFAEQAGLPILPGRKPFGGHIQSHDFIEAALLRRAGWGVHMVPGLAGSYEESPPSLADLAIRDRRWCQGNLQHMAVLRARGLHWVSRLHLLTGIGSYITAPMWLAFLVFGILISLQSRFEPPAYFGGRPSLFPHWPAVDPVRSKFVFVGTMAILLAPKLLAYVALLARGADRRGCGGALRALLSLLVETVLAGLIAPVAMVTQSVDVGAILLGRDSGWQTQRRDDGSIPWREVVWRYRGVTVFGLLLGLAAFLVSPFLFFWMSPVVLGLALAIPLAALTARRDVALRRAGLLRIPEEAHPPAELARASALYATLRAEEAQAAVGVRLLFGDPRLLEAHRCMLPPGRRPGRDPIDVVQVMARAKLAEAGTLDQALAGLTPAERAAALA
ncbi:MAG: glucans biosynthesis glucosyltransferase MdoH, partial [Proteobacteria bacterium]|nr:glucans biosynthesis glucosyltransferase MdoH [Pseudomonadota bacterium]